MHVRGEERAKWQELHKANSKKQRMLEMQRLDSFHDKPGGGTSGYGHVSMVAFQLPSVMVCGNVRLSSKAVQCAILSNGELPTDSIQMTVISWVCLSISFGVHVPLVWGRMTTT